jgi:hypothetical protein
VKQLLAVKVVYDRFLRKQGGIQGVADGPH